MSPSTDSPTPSSSSSTANSRKRKPQQDAIPSTDDPDDPDEPLEIDTNLRFKVTTSAAVEVEVKVIDPAACRVCGEKAGKHNYYGGRACASCRAFFRRAVQSKYNEIFYCTKGQSCEVNLLTRRSCQFCRFQKCLSAGMRAGWVLSEVERKLQARMAEEEILTEQKLAEVRARGDLEEAAQIESRKIVQTLISR